MLLNFALVVVVIWLILYMLAYCTFFRFVGLVTREHDGQYELMEFYWNDITEDYKVKPICRASEKTYNLWNADPNIMTLHDMIVDMRFKK